MPKTNAATRRIAMEATTSGVSLESRKLLRRNEFIFVGEERSAVRIHIFQYHSGTTHDRRQRVRCDDDRHSQGSCEEFRQSPDQGAAAGEIDAALHDVCEDLRWCRFEHILH